MLFLFVMYMLRMLETMTFMIADIKPPVRTINDRYITFNDMKM